MIYLILLLFAIPNQATREDKSSQNDKFLQGEAQRMFVTQAGFKVDHVLSQRNLVYNSGHTAPTENMHASLESLPRRSAKETDCPEHLYRNDFAVYSYNFGNKLRKNEKQMTKIGSYGIDAYFFTDSPKINAFNWNVTHVSVDISENGIPGSRLTGKRLKFVGHPKLEKYRYLIHVDSAPDRLDTLIEWLNNGLIQFVKSHPQKSFFAAKHRQRETIQQEVEKLKGDISQPRDKLAAWDNFLMSKYRVLNKIRLPELDIWVRDTHDRVFSRKWASIYDTLVENGLWSDQIVYSYAMKGFRTKIYITNINERAFHSYCVFPLLTNKSRDRFISQYKKTQASELDKNANEAKIWDTRVESEISVDGKVYHSSKWEQLWLDNIDAWQKHGICEELEQQKEQIKAFMKDTCSASTNTDWCLIDDSVHKVWYNIKDGQVSTRKPFNFFTWKPFPFTTISPLHKMSPKDDLIWSYFVNPDGTREYIEPLVSHLRHPLARCMFGDIFLTDRSYILPGNPGSSKTYLFDAGASRWGNGAGGPSLSYFASVWKRYGFDWSHIEGWEGSTTVTKFMASVPQEWRSRTHFHPEWISTSPDKQPFVPDVIRSTVSTKDYVVFKLDIDSKSVETAIVDHLLSHPNDLKYIDEFIWEHHVDNYIMAPIWNNTQDMSKSIGDSYEYFLKLRKRGVRAHSWV